jgi:hypothetical protein
MMEFIDIAFDYGVILIPHHCNPLVRCQVSSVDSYANYTALPVCVMQEAINTSFGKRRDTFATRAEPVGPPCASKQTAFIVTFATFIVQHRSLYLFVSLCIPSRFYLDDGSVLF